MSTSRLRDPSVCPLRFFVLPLVSLLVVKVCLYFSAEGPSIFSIGTNTYDHFELRIHKRIIDIIGYAASLLTLCCSSDPQLLKSISNIKLLPEVNVEIKMN